MELCGQGSSGSSPGKMLLIHVSILKPNPNLILNPDAAPE